MKCYFCQRECKNRDSVPPPSWAQVCWCPNHPRTVIYHFYKNSQIKTFDFEYYYIYNEVAYRFGYVVNAGENNQDNYFSVERLIDDKLIVYFDFIPNITPENAYDKLPTLLVFS